MFWWLINNRSRTVSVSQTLLMRQFSQSRGPAILSGLSYFHPLSYATATNGYVYMASGLDVMYKWDGRSASAVTVGVAAPETPLTISATGSGEISGTYTAYVRYVDRDGNYSNFSPISNSITVTNVSTIIYTNVPVPSDPKVVRKQILRNTAGQTLVYYVDVDTDDVTGTSFYSMRTDDELALQPAVPLFSSDLSRNLVLRFGLPPNDKAYIAFYQNRLFAYGERPYTAGHVEVNFGSPIVVGVGTHWTEAMADRLIYIRGADKAYLINSVDVATQTLTLAEQYMNGSDKFAAYAIRPTPANRNLLWYSEPGLFDAWDPTRPIEVAASDDLEDIGTGLASTQSFLYILQQRHVYRLTFFEDPVDDGGIFLSARRGCVNNRCWQSVDGFLYMLDDRGIYKFDGGEGVEELATPIADLFYFDSEEGELRINWSASELFFSTHDRNDATLRWHVSFSGQYLPRHAICFNYDTQQWWLEEYPWPLGHGILLKSINPIVMVAGHARKMYALSIGPLDVTNPQAGDTYGKVDSAGHMSLTAARGIAFPAAGVIGAPVTITLGRGKGQSRIVTVASGRTLSIDRPWQIQPDSTSVFQLGGIGWRWRAGWSRWIAGDINQVRRVTCSFRPAGRDATMDLRIFRDFSREPEKWMVSWPHIDEESSGVTITQDSPDVIVNLTQNKGFAQLSMDSWRDTHEWRTDNVSVELRGFSSRDVLRIYEMRLEGAEE